ncbi:MAG: DegQ family serine endoprotease [Deltaproteobacteria bacterium]|nr:DegQ family serine endoprotease [Deltaproteobacteria bacterium]
MKIKSIIKNNRHSIIFKSFIMVFALLSAVIVLPSAYQGADQCLAASAVPGSFAELVKQASPAVVHVAVEKTTKVTTQFSTPFGENSPFGYSDPFEFFRRFYGDQMPEEYDYTQQGLGTGFIIDKEGHILTNNHVVEGADKITVTLSGNKEYEAKVIGTDSKTDLALIKIEDAKDLKPLTLGDSDKLEVGDWVVAIGNPFGLDNTVTAGIVSAKYRRSLGTASYEDYIQTDAAINQGNSGGPLMNTNGEVIGINSSIYSQTGGSIGIGFAIPINMAKTLLPQLKKGKVVRGYMGVYIQDITSELNESMGLSLKDTKGALVTDVTEGGPADKAGLKSRDVIITFDGKEVKDSTELRLIVSSTPVDKVVKVDVLRKGEKKVFDLKVGELQDDEDAEDTQNYNQFQGRGNRNENQLNQLGFSVGEITSERARQYSLTDKSGVMILEVQNNSPASEAGLSAGMVIVEMDNEKINDLNQFNRKIGSYKTGDIIVFKVKSGEGSIFLTLKVED